MKLMDLGTASKEYKSAKVASASNNRASLDPKKSVAKFNESLDDIIDVATNFVL